MKKNGFTYIEVAIAFSIFGLMIMYVMRLNSVSNKNSAELQRNFKMLSIAEAQIEKYKAGMGADSVVDGYYITLSVNNVVKNIDASTQVAAKEIKVVVRKDQADPEEEAVVLRVLNEN